MVEVIAEAGVNHNGKPDLAFELVEHAQKAGADYVKFQTYSTELLVTKSAQQARYQTENTGVRESQFDMLRRLELSQSVFRDIFDYCSKIGIGFMSTAFDLPSLRFLVDALGVAQLKVASGELTNAPFLLEHARSGRNLIVSTGMARIEEVEQAMGVIAFGRVAEPSVKPSVAAFREALDSEEGKRAITQCVTLLHCTSQYPTPPHEVNLLAMPALGARFDVAYGFSDHTQGIAMPIAAAALGAAAIEKHFTVSRGLPGPDHQASLEPSELQEMVAGIRMVEKGLGSAAKRPTESELETAGVARRSLVAAARISAGAHFTEHNVTVMRPGGGMTPIGYWALLGREASRNYAPGDLIDE